MKNIGKTSQQLVTLVVLGALLAPSLVFGQAAAPARSIYTAPKAELDKITDEGMNRSQVMAHIGYLTDVIGPRLTNSPNFRRASEWARDTMAKWGTKASLEAFGPWGRGWSLKSFSIAVTEPTYKSVLAFPSAWTTSTKGPVTAEVVFIDVKDEKDFEQYKGKLKGKIVMISAPRELKNDPLGLGAPFSEEDLARLANYVKPSTPARTQEQTDASRLEFARKIAFLFKTQQLVASEGAAVLLENSQRGSGGAVMVHNATITAPPDPTIVKTLAGVTPWMKEAEPFVIPTVTMANEDYNRLVRLIRQGVTPKMTVDIQAQFHDEDLMAYNTIAEIPGTDPQSKDEIVMLGAHLDSWHAGSGATDNAAGSGVVMEAMRILMATGLQPRRTIRAALWSGEEQGLHGSKAYVEKHFAQLPKPTKEVPKPQPVKGADYEKLSVYFNLDNGAGRIRGIYLMDNAAAKPIFDEWLKPFHSLGAKTTTMMSRGASDHISFDNVGLPGFGFMQDPLNYMLDFGLRTHHTNQDSLDYIQADDMKQAATIMAAFIYQAAMMDEKMPRKEAKQ
ncbi:MAG: M20/M25/M40 family metallo-hydrolase [Blastocatellia bacterium]|nr:M20/M25/M40 family metallo-hydrolase [Blastocatellia bacterium]